MTATTDTTAFNLALRINPHDDTAKLVYADWLDEHDQPKAAARLRWWVDARRMMRAGVVWDKPTEWSDAANKFDAIKPQWVQRLYAVEFARVAREKYPLAKKWAKLAAVSDDSLAVAERYALLLATDEELSAAWSAAWSAARSAASSAARSAASSAARSAAWSAAWSAASSAAWSAASSAAESAARSAASSASRSAARSAAWSAAWSAARSAARSAAWSAASALLAFPMLEE